MTNKDNATMKRITSAALAAITLAAIIPTSALADEPANPVQGAVCNLYWFDRTYDEKEFDDIASSIASKPAAATFVDKASEFKCSEKKDEVNSSWGMWTGWLKQEKAGTYTFTCRGYDSGNYRYSIWINGKKCASATQGQYSFNVELTAGFNSVKIVSESNGGEALTITYKKAGSIKEPKSFGPENMFFDDDDE